MIYRLQLVVTIVAILSVAAGCSPVGAPPEPREISEARYVVLDSWSPDGGWIAEWVDMTTPSPDVPGASHLSLRFVEVESARNCTHEEVEQPEGTDGMLTVRWMDDGLVRVAGMQGIPCEGAFGLNPSPTTTPSTDEARSPSRSLVRIPPTIWHCGPESMVSGSTPRSRDDWRILGRSDGAARTVMSRRVQADSLPQPIQYRVELLDSTPR